MVAGFVPFRDGGYVGFTSIEDPGERGPATTRVSRSISRNRLKPTSVTSGTRWAWTRRCSKTASAGSSIPGATTAAELTEVPRRRFPPALLGRIVPEWLAKVNRSLGRDSPSPPRHDLALHDVVYVRLSTAIGRGGRQRVGS